jgi:hypothetical protein
MWTRAKADPVAPAAIRGAGTPMAALLESLSGVRRSVRAGMMPASGNNEGAPVSVARRITNQILKGSHMQRTCRSALHVIAVLATAVSATALGQAQESRQLGPYEATLQGSASGAPTLVLREADGRTTEYAVDGTVRAIRTAAHSPAGRVTILAEANGATYAVIIEPTAAVKIGEIRAASAAVTETGQFILWDREQGRVGSRTGSEFRLVDVDALPLPSDGSVPRLGGRVVQPTTAGAAAIRGSAITSIGDATFAFLALSPRVANASVVAVRAVAGAEPTVVSQPLAVSDFIAADTDAQPAVLTQGPTLSRVRARGLVLRLDFAGPSADTPGRSARVKLW